MPLELDLGEEFEEYAGSELGAPVVGDTEMTDIHELGLEEAGIEIPRRVRESLSPLSEIRPSEERELESTFHEMQRVSWYQPGREEESVHELQAPRQKRRKVLELDTALELRTAQIKEQQIDRSRILKPLSFLPRDPTLLALMQLQRSGGFVSNILGDDRMVGWAPELRDLFSVDIVRRSGELKRKRDSGVSDMYLEEGEKEAELEIPAEELPTVSGSELSVREPSTLEELRPGSEHPPSEHPEEYHVHDEFEETTMPLLHPAEAGPISQGTQHAVHMLRDFFGPAAEQSAEERQKKSVTFQQLLPEKTTSRRDATKMFFEILVLATKDAIKVEQKPVDIGGPIKLRAKRGLWGHWAEQGPSGQFQDIQETQNGVVEVES